MITAMLDIIQTLRLFQNVQNILVLNSQKILFSGPVWNTGSFLLNLNSRRKILCGVHMLRFRLRMFYLVAEIRYF